MQILVFGTFCDRPLIFVNLNLDLILLNSVSIKKLEKHNLESSNQNCDYQKLEDGYKKDLKN